MALAMPPPGSPTGVGMCVKKSSVSACTPRVTAKKRMKASGTSANSTAMPQSAVMTKETPLRTRGLLMRAPPAALTTGAARRAVPLPCRPMRQMRRRDTPLTSSVMMNSSSPISISACRYRSSAASLNSFAITAAIVYCGAKTESDSLGVLPITIVTAMVSPSARPKPSMMAPMMPTRPYCSATRMASHRVAPSAYAPSRCAAGTARSTSRATEEV